MNQIALFKNLGEEEGIRSLVDRFYDLMDELPEVRVIRELHPEDLAESRQKLFEFLTGWAGGPPLYVEKYGHPRLRMRHMPFPIGEDERDQWMMCMRKAMSDRELPESVVAFLDEKFWNIADFMRNKE